jgi:hypothetical protein
MTQAVAVVVNGELGSGKSTLARALAPHLGATVLSKDLLKEAMYEPLGLTTEERSLAGSVAAMRIMHALSAASASPLILEANWKPIDVEPLVALGRPLVQVVCRASADVLADRVLHRDRHPVHRDRAVPAVQRQVLDLIERDAFKPLDLPCPLIEVDTERAVDVAALADAVRAAVDRAVVRGE